MNKLGINIEEGTKVVMEGDCPVEDRTVTVTGGFGTKSFTSGRALFATDRYGNAIRLDSMEIERLA